MRYKIHHRTSYSYQTKVSYSHHLARLRPLERNIQNQVAFRLLISPTPDTLSTYHDYFGNMTYYFSITTPHRSLTIDSHSEVVIEPAATPQLENSPPWEQVRDTLRTSTQPTDLAAAEFTFASPLCPTHADFADYALQSFRRDTPILVATDDLTSRIHNDFTFDPKATTVMTRVSEVFQKRAGVCQDFAHLQIACLRSIGLPARYVSGYLRTEPPAGKPRLIGADATHAWISTYVPGQSWIAFDATNNVIPSVNHIDIAQGRDYHDICPVRGTVFGGGTQALGIGVTVTPFD